LDKMLKNKVAILTGSGRDIGRAAALLFAREAQGIGIWDFRPIRG